jgi:hypothetical protein
MTSSPFGFDANGDARFDYKAFVDQGFASQSKYGKAAGDKYTPEELQRVDTLLNITGNAPDTLEAMKEALDFRYRKIIEHFGHLNEESIEARVYVPRRSWKNGEPSYLDNPELRAEFVAELFDILLFHRAILAYAGISGEEFAQAAAEKMNYNSKRPDHNVNGTAQAEVNPAAELQGDCASAAYRAYEENGPKFSAGPDTSVLGEK